MKCGFLNSVIQSSVLIIVISFLLFFQGCLGLPTKHESAPIVRTGLKFTADSGYVSKGDILIFLATNALSDTLNDWWKQWKPSDTMGKYYRTEENGGFLLCVLSADDGQKVAANKLIALDAKGMMVASEDFHCDWCGLNPRTQALGKTGNYFVTYTCGHGSGFSSSWFTLFKSLAGRVGLSAIMEGQYVGAPQCQSISAAWKMAGDTCTVSYTIENSRSTENGCEPLNVQKVIILYHFKNGNWSATDSSRLRAMNIAE